MSQTTGVSVTKNLGFKCVCKEADFCQSCSFKRCSYFVLLNTNEQRNIGHGSETENPSSGDPTLAKIMYSTYVKLSMYVCMYVHTNYECM